METTKQNISVLMASGLVALMLLPVFSACARPLGAHGEGADGGSTSCQTFWNCSPGTQTCGAFPPCVDGLCRSDLEPVWVDCGECTSPDQCLVAEPMSCCFGCPEVIGLEELARRPCWYQRGRPPEVVPQECDVDCAQCAPCFPQPLGASCNDGVCEASRWGCPGEPEGQVVEVSTEELVKNPERYLGGAISLTGALYPVFLTCNDNCPAPGCCQANLALDGVVELVGLACDLYPGALGDDYCVEEFYPFHWGPGEGAGPLPGDFVTIVGTVVRQGSPPWELPVIHVDSLEMRRPTGISGHYATVVTEVVFDTESCGLSPVVEGDSGHLYLATVGTTPGSAVKVYSGAFPCTLGGEYLGEIVSEGWFDARVPVLCAGCCCDFVIDGEVFGDSLEGHYYYDDGQCIIEASFTGWRVERELGR